MQIISSPAPTVSSASTTPSAPTRHTTYEDLAALLTASVVVSLGLYILKSAGATTGGTDGIALLLSQVFGINMGAAIFALALPFYALALWQKGARFALRSFISVTLISVLSSFISVLMGPLQVAPLYGAIVGNILIGLGILMLFRHDASPAGFTVVSLIAQEKMGWRAGYVQIGIDALIVAGALVYAPPATVLISGVGVAMVGAILAMNHRPERYLGR